MSDLNITMRSADGERSYSLNFDDLPSTVRNRVIMAAMVVSSLFESGRLEVASGDTEAEDAAVELAGSLSDMDSYAREVSKRDLVSRTQVGLVQ